VELPVLNKQLDRLNYATMGEMVKDLMAGKLTHLTEDQQIEIMKTNLQANGQITGLSGKPYEFYKQVDLIEKYHEHTGNSYRNYFERYASIFFGPSPDVELFKFKPHKRSWILQQLKDLVIIILENTITEK
jgi:hypothetical protein